MTGMILLRSIARPPKRETMSVRRKNWFPPHGKNRNSIYTTTKGKQAGERAETMWLKTYASLLARKAGRQAGRRKSRDYG